MFLAQHPALLFLIAIAVVGMAAIAKTAPDAKKGGKRVRVQQSSSKEAPAPARAQPLESEFAPMKVLTDTEVKFFRQLQGVLTDELIFPQVAMSALIKPTGRGTQYWSSFGKISQKRVDFAIYRKDLSLVAIIELDDPSHDKREEEDQQRDAYLKSAGIRTVRLDVRKWPDDATIRAKIYPSVARPASPRPPAPVPSQTPVVTPVSVPPAHGTSPVAQDAQAA
ncbi:DUF2726 domain-containing protein [Paraburkholderia caledonica]|jgi:hypothetical protein